MKRHLLIILALVILPFIGRATHIVGGSITYEHLGGSTYRLTLKLFKDCAPGTWSFPNPVNLRITYPNGTLYSTVSIPYPGQDTLSPFIDTCVIDPGICVSQAVYTTIVNNLPPNPGGYHIYYQSCCRNFSILNINNPGSMGASFYAHIPDNAQFLTNSSPDWVDYPPVFVCASQPLVLDQSATDLDGDSLVYDLYTPWSDNIPTFPGSVATFTNVTYVAGYSFNSPLDIVGPPPTMFIDAQTGILTTTPPAIGQYVVGVKVSEYRDGQWLSTVYRDFQLNVVVCPPPALAGIGPSDACSGTAVVFDNTSSGTANNFFWDFGDGASTTDTSYSANPSYTYPGIGTYTVTLIAQQGTPCADTTTRDITVAWAASDFTSNSPVCVNSPVNFLDASTSSINSVISTWFWDFGDGITSSLPNPSHLYTAGGTYTVTLYSYNNFGCPDSIQYTVDIQDLPDANAGNDTIMCMNNPSITISGSVGSATGGLWVGDSSFIPNASTLTTDYSPSAAELAAGQAIIVLTTTGNGLCPSDEDTLLINIVPGPTSDAGPAQILVCEDTAYVPLSGTITVSTGGSWTSTGTGTFSPSADSLNVNYLPTSADTAAGSVYAILTTIGNGSCIATSDSIEIVFTPAPNLTASAPDTACAADFIPLTGFSETGAAVWQTLGNGTFSPSDSVISPFYIPGPADTAAGQVTLIITSLNNGGCLAQYDTVVIDIIPAPTPLFNFNEVCMNEQTVFSDQSSSVGTIVSWDWDMGDGTGISSAQNPNYIYGSAGVYSVSLVVTSNNGCKDTLVQPVTVYYLPEPGFYADGVCLNTGTLFNDTSVVADGTIVTWNWDLGDSTSSTSSTPSHIYPNDGTYSVTLVVTSNYGCVDSINQNVVVLPGPDAAFSSSTYSANLFENIVFTDGSAPLPLVNWYWDFGDSIGSSTNQNPNYNYGAAGTYTVTLVVTDANGCVDTTYSEIVIFLPPNLPNAFSPNGDGQNDILYVLGGPFKELDYKIYNNWGEVIFESNNQSIGWDGAFDGIDQPISVYIATVIATTEDDVVHKLELDVTLLR